LNRQIIIDGFLYEVNEKDLLINRVDGKIKTKSVKPNGYEYYRFNHKGKRFNVYCHRFIYEFYRGKIPKEMTVDHIDGDKKNNCIGNLQLLSQRDNAIKGNAKRYLVITPNGEEIEILNLTAFCKSNDLSYVCMNSLANKRDGSQFHKGWKCYVK